jgi:hypothetical protein
MIGPGASCLHDCEEHTLKSDTRTGLVTVAAGIALLTAACSSSSSTPGVASLGSTTGTATTGSSASAAPTGSPTTLLDEWATCERSHGDPNQTDPTVDSNKVIHITYPANHGPQDGPQSSDPCKYYLTAASTALRGGQPIQKPDPAKLLAFSQCMRANGIPDFPDPSGSGLSIKSSPGSDLNPNNPTFKNAGKVCSKKTGVGAGLGGGPPQPGSIEAQSANGGPGVNG